MIATVSYETRRLPVDEIVSLAGRRGVDEKVVEKLAESITRLGLQIPITVRMVDDHVDEETGEVGRAYVLVTGAHRLATFRRLGEDYIPAVVRDCNETEARLWEISENLHRAELTVLERDEQVNEWVTLVEKPAQLGQVSVGGRGNESGVAAASRSLNIPRSSVQRSLQVASLSDETKEAARAAGLDNNQTALLAAHKDGKTAEEAAKASGEDAARAKAAAEQARIEKEAEDRRRKQKERREDKKDDRERKQRKAQELREQAEEVIELLGRENMPYVLGLLEDNPRALAMAIRAAIAA